MKKYFYSFILSILLLTTFGQTISFGDELKTVNFNKDWTITFNNAIDKSSVNNHSIYVYDSTYKKLLTNISFGDKSNSIIITPKNNYLPNSTYSIYVSNRVTSSNKINMQDDYIYKFKTEKLSSSNLSTFSNTLENLSVNINYISDNQVITKKGLLTYNSNINKPIIISYFDKDLNAKDVEIFFKNNKLSGEIYSYDQSSNLIIYTIHDIDISSIINMSTSTYEYEYIYNFKNVLNKDALSSQNNLTSTILINSSGDVVGLMYEESPGNHKKIFFKDVNLEKNLSLPLASINSLYMNLKPPIITDIKYLTSKEIITLNLNSSEKFILYFSIDNKTYKPIYNSNGENQIYTKSNLAIPLSALKLKEIADSTEIYFKASSFKNNSESYLSDHISILITKLSEADVAKNIVMNGTLTQSDNKSIGKAFNDYFSSCTWTYINNVPFPEVKFKGQGIYKGTYREITFLFSVNVPSQNFRLESVTIDNIPLNFSELPYLLKTIYN